jgi:tetratricopeptide (TPR) repeat protein
MMSKHGTPATLRLAAVSFVSAVALALPQAALALSCDDIMSLVEHGVPESVVVNTVKTSGALFSADEVRCLEDRGAPAAVVAQAKDMTASEDPGTAAPVPVEKVDEGGSDLDVDDEFETKAKAGAQRQLSDGENVADGAEPPKLKEAVAQYQAKKPLAASLMLFELLESGKYPEFEPKVNYYLGRSLEMLDMHHTAQYHYMQVVRRPDSQYFAYALPKMVKIARLTGNDIELKRIVAKIPPDSYPPRAKSDLYYLLGVRAYDKDDLSRAGKYFGQVAQNSPYYLKAEYYRGVIYNQQGKLKSAVRSFRDVYRQEVEVANDPRAIAEVEELKDLALLNIARIYYGIERYDESSNYYNLVPHKSPHWAEALFELGWANFMQGYLNNTLGQLLTVRSGFFSEDQWLPEAQLLRSLTYFNLCEYNKVEKILIDFDQRYRPAHAEMTSFVDQYKTSEGKKLADQAWDTYFGREKKDDSVLPKSFFVRVLRNNELAGIVTHLDLMDTEEGLIAKQKTRWADVMGPYLRKILETDRQRYKRYAGLRFLSEMARQSNKVADLLTQAEIIRFEVVDAQRVDYQYKSQNADLGEALDRVDLDFATAVDFIYWPFNGEFWQDELGYYRYTEQGSCK